MTVLAGFAAFVVMTAAVGVMIRLVHGRWLDGGQSFGYWRKRTHDEERADARSG